MRVILAFVMLLGLAWPATAQDDPTPWQATITGQIEAFRAQDGEAALALAGEGFRTQFAGQPAAFYAAILASGYAPIVQSRSHSFGKSRQLSDSVVAQVVRLVGPDQSLYEAIYQLENEADLGWRVLGVVLRKDAGVAI